MGVSAVPALIFEHCPGILSFIAYVYKLRMDVFTIFNISCLEIVLYLMHNILIEILYRSS